LFLLYLKLFLFKCYTPQAMTTPAPPPLVAADTAWLLVATALVLLMVPGLALFYGGLVRAKNALNTIMMTLAGFAVAAMAWAGLGYSLAFAPGSPLLGGLDHVALAGVDFAARGPVPHLLYFAFQTTFAGIAVALVAGALVERLRFSAWLAFAALWTVVVYAPVCRWVWGTSTAAPRRWWPPR
jgi:Amt family ammonium transporter